ncbi:SO_0444 family Cu/Zn efflux transporter [Candidatus Ruminimicrobium bovinum]|uniref:SO_0444 family Cu/Zn efflux transporter n=1 Tax=Candidatus Ruminimicrobium bovinum TaxID=3242779 RepID=UPI0039B8F3C9
MEIIKIIFSIFNEMSFYLLLGFLFAGILHVLVPQQLFSKYLSKNNWVSVLYATLFGIPLPLCSCGVIPTAMALYKEGASKGSVISFLIATPQTGVDSIIATYSLLGLPFAIIRPVAAFFTSIFAGLVTNIFTLKENNVKVSVQKNKDNQKLSFNQKIKKVFQYGYVEMMEDIGKMLLFGLVIAGLIAYFVPDNFFTIFKGNTLLTMLLILVVAIPMYVCATGSIPIAIALMMKGMSPGTALVLLMAGPAANIASMMVIGKVLGKKTFIVYLITLIIGAICFGLFIDNFLPASWFDVSKFAMTAHNHNGGFYCFKVICSFILFALLVNSILFKKNREEAEIMENNSTNKIAFKINGMSCNHCKNNVTKVISNLKSVKDVIVNLSEGIAYVDGNPTDEEIKTAVEAIGFEFKGRI